MLEPQQCQDWASDPQVLNALRTNGTSRLPLNHEQQPHQQCVMTRSKARQIYLLLSTKISLLLLIDTAPIRLPGSPMLHFTAPAQISPNICHPHTSTQYHLRLPLLSPLPRYLICSLISSETSVARHPHHLQWFSPVWHLPHHSLQSLKFTTPFPLRAGPPPGKCEQILLRQRCMGAVFFFCSLE